MKHKEILRQILHIFVGIVTIFLIYFNILTSMRIFILILIGIVLSLLSKRFSLPVISWFLRKFERENVIHRFPGRGVIFFLVGVLLSLRLFSKDIALASITILTLGDAVSHIFGGLFGKTRQPLNGDGKKKLEGTIVGIVVAFLGALFFVSPLYAFFGSLSGMMAETLQLKLNGREVDDNIIVPLASGTIMLLIRHYL